ncbi:hypothetical protein [Sphingopyxis granuli]|jgi:hypothetical protein|uniref:hypothetical protein n=1 Tax=Sphingopyxis granuli TaxID=267128 RepID=UPI000CB39BAA|nr:hypothetical protein [Sphingopyxis granuli]PKQ00821.1 MAG: stability/partitioning determinant [Alphaproteobacteria bacterium HGW-Alphaproteobacteria-13]QUM74637.1 stability/partitioning determinant [Sphingopyxis granuli]
MSDRANPFANLGTEFEKRPPPAKPDVQMIDELADRSDFPSRAARPDAAPARKPMSQRRHVTGRNKQINIKATDETIQLLYDITDNLGQPMGAVLDLALRALARERGI